MTKIDWYRICWETKTKWIKIALYTFCWGLLSIAAGYPKFCLHGETDIFTTATIYQFCMDFLSPAFLFLALFLLDVTVVISKKWFNEKNINAFKWIFVALLLFFGCLTILIHIPISSEQKQIALKVVIFILMWSFIVSIKGVTFYLQGDWEEAPIFVNKNINNKFD